MRQTEPGRVAPGAGAARSVTSQYPPMRKWKKVILWSVGLLSVAGVGIGAAEYLRFRRTPDWYTADTSTPEQRASAADRVEDTLRRLYDWSAGRHARGADRAAPVATPVVAEPATDAAFPLSFTDAQLNAFFDRWSNFQDRRATIDKYVKDPRIIVQDGHLIIAGQVRDGGVIVSLFLDPSVSHTDGRVRLQLTQVMAGVIQVPEVFFASQRTSLERVLAQNLPADQQKAALTPDGLANGAAATAAMDEMLLGVLRGRETEPVIFVPVTASPTAPLLPVRISAVTARDHTLAMTARAVPVAERQRLLDEIRRPDDPDGAPAPPASP
jgi:hypothetical protein